MKKSDLLAIQFCVHSNLLRILQLIEDDSNLYPTKKSKWGGTKLNKNNVELRQRMHLLRKDMIQLEKLMKAVGECENTIF